MGLGGRLRGWLSGLAVLRDRRARWRMAAIVLLAMIAQILRNFVVLRASGIDVSVLDATAVLIGVAVLGILPLGPSTGAGATLLVLGSHDLGAVAAAGLLLTATGALGALIYGGWALTDRGWTRPPGLAACGPTTSGPVVRRRVRPPCERRWRPFPPRAANAVRSPTSAASPASRWRASSHPSTRPGRAWPEARDFGARCGLRR